MLRYEGSLELACHRYANADVFRLPSPRLVALLEGCLRHASGGSHNLNPLQYPARNVLWMTFCNSPCIL